MSEPAGQEAPRYPQARWRLERAGDGSSYVLMIWTQPDGDRYAVQPLCLPMTVEEMYRLLHQGDRVVSWSASSADGTFTPPPAQPPLAPDEVRRHLSISGYIVISRDIEAHTRLVASTPWANWVEEVPAPQAGGVAWFVNVFAADDIQFAQAADVYRAELRPTAYAGGPDAG
jgi:hypothetical protein